MRYSRAVAIPGFDFREGVVDFVRGGGVKHVLAKFLLKIGLKRIAS